MEKIVPQVRLTSSFAGFIGYVQSFTNTLMQVNKWTCLESLLITNYVLSVNKTCNFLLIIRSL